MKGAVFGREGRRALAHAWAVTSVEKLPGYAAARGDIVALLEAAHGAVARSVNSLMTATYWEIGRRIVEFEQGGKGRAGYGEALINRLSQDLTRRFGRGYSRPNIWRMRLFHLAWPEERIWQTLSAKSARGPIRPTASAKLANLNILSTLSRRESTAGAIARRV
jgi:hypothetical protein